MLNALNMIPDNHQPPQPQNRNDPYDNRIGNGALPPGFQGSQNRAYTRAVQGDELMGQRLGALLDSNSRYMRSARNRGLEQAGSRGMLNSSMAAGNAQRAAIDAGAPIAAQEAGAFMQAASENQRWLNERQMEIDRLAAAEANSRASGAEAAASAGLRLQMQREQLAFEGEQRGLDRVQALYEADQQLGNQMALGEANFGWDLGRDAFQFGNEDFRANRDFGFRGAEDWRQFGFQDYAANRDFGFEDFAANRDFGFQTQRDRTQFGFERQMQQDRFNQGMQDYAFRTGVDLRAQGASFMSRMAELAALDPELYNPEVVGAMTSTFLPMFDDFATDFFSQFSFGGGGSSRTRRRRGG